MSIDDFDKPLDVDLLIKSLMGMFVVGMQIQGDIHEFSPVVQDLGIFPAGKFYGFLPSFVNSHIDVFKGLIYLVFDFIPNGVYSNLHFQVFPHFEMIVFIDFFDKIEIPAH